MKLELDRNLAKTVLALIPAGLLSSGIPLVDQYFASELSQEYLRIHVLTSLISLLFAALGKALGHSLLIAAGKANEGLRKELLKGAIVFSSFVGLIFSLLGLVASPLYLVTYRLGTIGSSAHLYLAMQMVIGTLLLIMSINTYALLTLRQTKIILRSNFAAFALNLAGNLAAVKLITSTDTAFLGLALSSIVSGAAAVSIQLRFILGLNQFSLGAARAFWRRCKDMIFGQVTSTIVLVGMPFLAAWQYQYRFTGEAASIYSAANSAYQFLSLPIYACLGAGAAALSEVVRTGNRQRSATLFRTLGAIQLSLSVVPATLVMACSTRYLNLALHQIFQWPLVLMFSVLMFRPMILAFSSQALLTLRILERQKFVAMVDATSHAAMLVLLWAFGPFLAVHWATIIAIVLPQAIGAMVLQKAAGKASVNLPSGHPYVKPA